MHENTGSGLRCHKKNRTKEINLKTEEITKTNFIYFFFSFFVSSAWEKKYQEGHIDNDDNNKKKKEEAIITARVEAEKKKKKKENKTKKKVSLVDPDFPIRFVCVCVCVPRTEIEKKKVTLLAIVPHSGSGRRKKKKHVAGAWENGEKNLINNNPEPKEKKEKNLSLGRPFHLANPAVARLIFAAYWNVFANFFSFFFFFFFFLKKKEKEKRRMLLFCPRFSPRPSPPVPRPVFVFGQKNLAKKIALESSGNVDRRERNFLS